MHAFRRFALPLVLAAATPLAAQQPAPQGPVRSMMHGYTLAMTAFQQGRPNDALGLLRQAEAFSPGAPVLLLLQADAQRRTGDAAGAMATLRRMAWVGLLRDLRTDTAWRALHALPGFDSLAQALVDNARPVVRGDTAVVLADPDLVPESLARDPETGTLYVGSMGRRAIVRVAGRDTQEPFIASGRDGLGQVLGMQVQPRTRRLWVANFVPDTSKPRSPMGVVGRAQLHVFELPSGRLLARWALPDATPHLLNDIAFTDDGTAYLTDSHGGAVYALRGTSDSLARFHDGDASRFGYPNGIVVAPDGRALVVAHAEGLTRVDLATRAATPIDMTAGFAGRIDGLYRCGRDLVGVQALAQDYRIVRLRLDDAGTRVVSATTVERRHPAMRVPTTGTVHGDTLLYIADSGLPRLRDDGSVTPAPAGVRSVVVRVPLGAGCRGA